jgi:hypothetical protein
MAAIAIGATVVSAGTAAYSANQQKKAAQAAAQAGQATPVNIDAVSKQAEEQARRNIKNSIALEQQYDPGVANARQTAINQFNKQLTSDSPYLTQVRNLALGVNGGPSIYESPAIKAAVDKAMALSNRSGVPYAELPVEVSNLATRKALSTAGRVGGGLNLGRDLVARDLGLTSLQLGQQQEQNEINRINTLLGTGQSELGVRQGGIGTLSNLAGQDFSRALSAAQFTQALQRPEVGLDPSAIANLATGNVATQNQNAQNQANLIMNQANINSQMYGQLAGALGSAAGAYFGRPQGGGGTGSPKITYDEFLKQNPPKSGG